MFIARYIDNFYVILMKGKRITRSDTTNRNTGLFALFE